jgi:hypothetical protein
MANSASTHPRAARRLREHRRGPERHARSSRTQDNRFHRHLVTVLANVGVHVCICAEDMSGSMTIPASAPVAYPPSGASAAALPLPVKLTEVKGASAPVASPPSGAAAAALPLPVKPTEVKDAPDMRLTFKVLIPGLTHKLMLSSGATVGAMKKAYNCAFGGATDSTPFVFQNQSLSPLSAVLSSFGVRDGSVIHCQAWS